MIWILPETGAGGFGSSARTAAIAETSVRIASQGFMMVSPRAIVSCRLANRNKLEQARLFSVEIAQWIGLTPVRFSQITPATRRGSLGDELPALPSERAAALKQHDNVPGEPN